MKNFKLLKSTFYNIQIVKVDGDSVKLRGGHYRSGLFLRTSTMEVNIGKDEISTEITQ